MSYKYFAITADTLPMFIPLMDERAKRLCRDDESILKAGAVNDDGIPSGVLLLGIHIEGFGDIRYMYTSVPERRKGLMRGMFEFLSPVLSKCGIQNLYLLRIETLEGECEASIKGFCKGMGGVVELVSDHMVSVSAREVIKKTGKRSDRCCSLLTLHPMLMREAINKVEESATLRVYYFLSMNNDDIIRAFDPASSAILKEDSIDEFMLFVPREDDQGVTLVYMYGRDSRSLAMMLGHAAESAVERFGEDARISFVAINGIGEGMGKLFKENRSWMKLERVDFQVENFL